MCSLACIAPLDQCQRNGNCGICDCEKHGGHKKAASASRSVIAGKKVERDKAENERYVVNAVFQHRLPALDRKELKRKGERHAKAEDQKEILCADAGHLHRKHKGKKIKNGQNQGGVHRTAAQNVQNSIHSYAPNGVNAHILAYFGALCKC